MLENNKVLLAHLLPETRAFFKTFFQKLVLNWPKM